MYNAFSEFLNSCAAFFCLLLFSSLFVLEQVMQTINHYVWLIVDFSPMYIYMLILTGKIFDITS